MIEAGVYPTRSDAEFAAAALTGAGIQSVLMAIRAAPAPLTRDEARSLLGQTMGLVAVTSALFALGAYIGRDASGDWAVLWFIAAFALLLAVNVASQRSEQLGVSLLFGVGLLLGLAVAPTVSYYAGGDPQVVWEAGGATALFITGFGATGYALRRDLAPLTRYLVWALIALISFGIVLIFVQIPGGSVACAIAGLAIFAGLTLFDFQRLQTTKNIRTAPLLAFP